MDGVGRHSERGGEQSDSNEGDAAYSLPEWRFGLHVATV